MEDDDQNDRPKPIEVGVSEGRVGAFSSGTLAGGESKNSFFGAKREEWRSGRGSGNTTISFSKR
jgi:hypothetical protein